MNDRVRSVIGALIGRRGPRIAGVVLAVGALTAAPMVFASPASAGQVTYFTASIQTLNSVPVVAGATGVIFNGTVSNPANSASAIGTLKATAPAGLKNLHASYTTPPAVGSKTVTIVGNVLTLGNLGLKPGQSVGFTITADSTDLSACPSIISRTWAVAASGSGNGTPVFNGGTLGLKVVSPCQLAFGQQPTETSVNSSINPAVTVIVEDADGHQVDVSDNVALTIKTGPAAGNLSGGGPVSASHGLATFGNVQLDTSGSYTLSASDSTTPSATGATSNPFTVDNPSSSSASGCTDKCSATVTDGPQTTTVSGTGNTGGGQITLTLQPADPGLNCGDTFIHAPFESSETSTNVGQTLDVTVTFTNTAAARDGSNVAVCYVQTSPYMWVSADGTHVGAGTPALLGQCMNADKDPSQIGEADEFGTIENERDAPCFYDISSDGTTVTEHLLIPGNDPGFH